MAKTTTANEPVQGIDPGGTRPAKGKDPAKKPSSSEPGAASTQKVKSGDRNTMKKQKP